MKKEPIVTDECIFYNHAVKFQHPFWNKTLKTARIIIDATCGNGHDFCYLYERARKDAVLYGVDIQKEAIIATKNMISSYKQSTDAPIVHLIEGSHENFQALGIQGPYDLIVFNLGYLPKGNHRIMTHESTTIKALESALQDMNPQGLITIVAYPGTDEGAREMSMVALYLSRLDQKKYDVSKWEPINQIHKPPVLFFIKGRENI